MAPLAILAAKLAAPLLPGLLGKLFSPKVEEVATTAKIIIDKAIEITGEKEPEKAVAAIEASPELQLKLKESENELTAKLAEEDTKRQLAVLDQMGKEAQSDKWWISGWRPFNGFAFGATLFIDYIFSQFFVLFIHVCGELYNIKVLTDFKWDHVPFPVYCFWATVLGVNGYTRGKEKLEKVKQTNGGSLAIADIIKTFAQGAIGR